MNFHQIILDPPFKRNKGKIGKLSYRWMHGQQAVMNTPDMSKVKRNATQKANRQRSAEAIADPIASAGYEEMGKQAGRQPFRVAVSDFLAGKDLLEKK